VASFHHRNRLEHLFDFLRVPSVKSGGVPVGTLWGFSPLGTILARLTDGSCGTFAHTFDS